MSRLRLLAAVLAIAGLAAPALGDEHAPVIAVLGVGQERQSPDLQSAQDGLVHLVQSELAARSAARMVSRRQTALFLEELGMGAVRLTEPETSQRFGSAVSADYLVLVQVSGDGALRATVTVTHVPSGKQVWGASFSGEQIASLADDMSGALVEALDLPPPQAVVVGAGPLPMVAVLDFRSGGAASPFDRHLADLADLLSADLSALEVPLVERQKLGAVLEELGLSASGLVRSADIGKVGRLLGVQRMVDTVMIASNQTVLLDSQVIEPETGLVVGSCRVSSDEQHLPAAEQELAMELARVLRVPITEAGRSALSRQATTSLEAALHGAAGWRLGHSGQAEEAVKEYQQAIYLDPTVAGWWGQLGQQYQALDDWGSYGEAMQRFFAAAEGAAAPGVLAHMAQELSDAKIWQGHAAESEAAARLAMHYHEDRHVYWKILRAQAEQGKLAEARDLCESLVGRQDVPYDEMIDGWVSFLGWFTGVVGAENAKDADVREMLDSASRFLDLLGERTADSDDGIGAVLADLLLVCSTGQTCENLDLDAKGAYLEGCLAIARRMTAEHRHGISLPARGWLVAGVLQYKLDDPEAAIDSLNHCLREYRGENYDSGHSAIRVGPSAGLVYYVLGRAYQQQGRRQEAIEAYQTTLMLLDSGRAQAEDARKRLEALGAGPLPPAPWLRRVGGAGRSLEADPRQRLAHWLRHEGYDLREGRWIVGGEAFLPLSAQGIQVLVWEGRPTDYPSSEQLRAYVAGGGRLLICLSSQPSIAIIGPTMATSSQTMDPSLNWLLPTFGMSMSERAREARSVPLETVAVEPALALGDSPSYRGTWFPLQVESVTGVAVVVHGADGQGPDAVVAAASIGFGKLAVVSLRNWFPGADEDEERDPWQYTLLAGILDWFANDDLPQRYPAAAEQWAAGRNLEAVEEYGAAVQELDDIDDAAPSAADARYWAACLVSDRLGDTDGAARRWRQVASSSKADPWLVRMAHLRLGVAAVRAGDERTSTQELSVAAGDRPDRIWGQAWVAAGDLKLAQGDYLGAAQSFRNVADELGHSEERFRALFGLAYSLERQGKPEAAARVYDAIVVEFGKAPLPRDIDTRWPDPWQIYYPTDKRSDEPTVADAVAVARLR